MFKGHVIKPVRFSKSKNSEAPSRGVVRDVKEPPPFCNLKLSSTNLLDCRLHQYKSSVLMSDSNIEYLIWASNSSNMSIVEDDSWAVSNFEFKIPPGRCGVVDSNSVSGERSDGSTRIIISDRNGRSISRVLSISFIRGDNPLNTYTLTNGIEFDYHNSGFVFIKDNMLSRTKLRPKPSYPASFSSDRGDVITNVEYVVEPTKFWWTKNDSSNERFLFNNQTQRWEPLKGTHAINIGVVENKIFELEPKITGLKIGSYLFGDWLNDDFYSTIRIGKLPNRHSKPISKILVVGDENVSDYIFSDEHAVIGVENNSILWNPSFIEDYLGENLWYLPIKFDRSFDGLVGKIGDDLFISPVPMWGENPFIRIGSRNYLNNILVDNDLELEFTDPGEGSVVVSLSTGRLKFSQSDLDKSNTSSKFFEVDYYDNNVWYDGVSLNTIPQPLKTPVPLVDEFGIETVITPGGELYVPDAIPCPGFGISGILHIPDGSGLEPLDGDVPVRAGGDEISDSPTGLVREANCVGESIFFTDDYCFTNTKVVGYLNDLPKLNIKIKEDEVILSKQDVFGSKIEINKSTRSKLNGKKLYFLQTEFTPSKYFGYARVVSDKSEPFNLDGNEKLFLSINGVNYSWMSPGRGSYTAKQIAESINSEIGLNRCYSDRGKLIIETNTLFGELEIGPTSGDKIDLSGSSKLGFTPCNIVNTSIQKFGWYVDTGLSIGFYRNKFNKNRNKTGNDYNSVSLKDGVVSSSITQIPFVFVGDRLLTDVPGYDFGSHFVVENGSKLNYLKNYKDVVYQFDNIRPQFSWAKSSENMILVDQKTSVINLGKNNIFMGSFHAQGNGLYVSDDGKEYIPYTEGKDFEAVGGGSVGSIVLTEELGGILSSGNCGVLSSGSIVFEDPLSSFIDDGVVEGNVLKIKSTGNCYTIISVLDQGQLLVDVPFDTSSSPEGWEIFDGKPQPDLNESIIADVVFKNFNFLKENCVSVFVITKFGDVPRSSGIQTLNRGKINVINSFNLGRETGIRVGGSSGIDLGIYYLGFLDLGIISNSMLFIPISDYRVIGGAFGISIGDVEFRHGVGLTGVDDFSVIIQDNNIEYLLSTGELKFAENLLELYAGCRVQYEEDFISPNMVPQDVVEVNPFTGFINFSSHSINNYGGKGFYLVERMVHENRDDISLEPVSGTFSFFKPLDSGQMVEVEYYIADDSGNLLIENGDAVFVKEKLPVYVSMEDVEKINDMEFSFNKLKRTLVKDGAVCYVNNVKQNPALKFQGVIDYNNNKVVFSKPVNDGSIIRVSYLVYEMSGGETVFTTSKRPIYNPPFFIEKGSDHFYLEGNRDEISVGSLLRIGEVSLYISSCSYDENLDKTKIGITPTPSVEVGSRSPGNNRLSLISNAVLNSSAGGNEYGGFFKEIGFGFDNVTRNSNTINVHANVYDEAIPGKIIEINNCPYNITSRELSDNGSITKIFVSSPFVDNYGPGSKIRISVRPVYPDMSKTILGVGELHPGKNIELIEFGVIDGNRRLPGRILKRDEDYRIDTLTGNVFLREGFTGENNSPRKLVIRCTKIRNLEPRKLGSRRLLPRIKASYLYNNTPSIGDGVLGKKLYGRYYYRNPDSFYLASKMIGDEIENYLADAENESFDGERPVFVTSVEINNDKSGNVGPLFNLENEKITDRMNRNIVSVYHSLCSGLEQTIEAIDGGVIGDRSGKFRFYIGTGSDYPGPGEEDQITGDIVEKFIWSEVFFSKNGLITVNRGDYVVDPRTAMLSNGLVTGRYIDSNYFDELLNEQKEYIRNEIDDIVMFGRNRPSQATISGSMPPVRKMYSTGLYGSIFEPGNFSRFYPEKAKAFTTTDPGIGYDESTGNGGYYTYGRWVFDGSGLSKKSTRRKPIAKISNPVLGTISNILDCTVNKRFPRSRLAGYSGIGYPVLEPLTNNIPTFLLSMVAIKDFPVDADDVSTLNYLRSNSIDEDAIIDISTGDPGLSIPPFVANTENSVEAFLKNNPMQLSLGKPDGSVLNVLYDGNPVFVYEVYHGCLVTLVSWTTAPAQVAVTDPNLLNPVDGEFEIGDTIILSPPYSFKTPISDPVETGEMEMLRIHKDGYNVGSDIGLDRRNGNLIDITLPSFYDPYFFPLKEIYGQNPPLPYTDLELDVKFGNSRTEPLMFPAMGGRYLNDDGEETIPYLYNSNSEKLCLRNFENIVNVVDYPDEYRCTDGRILNVNDGNIPPAALITNINVLQNDPGLGIVPLKKHDLLFIQINNNLLNGSQGFIEVGDVSYNGSVSIIEPPRFVSKTSRGNRIRYEIFNAMVWNTNNVADGILIYENGVDTIFEINTTDIFFNDGRVGINGGLNNIISGVFGLNENLIRIKIYSKNNDLLTTFRISGDPSNSLGWGARNVYGNSSSWLGFSLSSPEFHQKTIVLPHTTGIFDFVSCGGTSPGPVGPFNFTVDVLARNGAVTGSKWSTGTVTAYIDDDRLSFHESIDLSHTYERTDQFPCSLRVDTVTDSRTEDLEVNSNVETNMNLGFSFLYRGTGDPGIVGSFLIASAPGADDEKGTLKVMGFEGNGNIPISAENIVFSAIASSGAIITGTGSCDGNRHDYEDRVTGLIMSSYDDIKKGYLLTIKEQDPPVPGATTKAGTYVINKYVKPDFPTSFHQKMILESEVGSNSGFTPIKFPVIRNWSKDDSTITVNTLLPFKNRNSINSPTGHAFKSSGKIFIIIDISSIKDSSGYLTSVIGASYLGVDENTNTFIDVIDYVDIEGNAISSDDFYSLLRVGARVSGFVYLETDVDYVGSTNLLMPTPFYYGITHFSIGSNITSDSGDFGYKTFSYDLNEIRNDNFVGGTLVVDKLNKQNPGIFDLRSCVYDNTLGMISLEMVNPAQWHDIRTFDPPPGLFYELPCLLPGDILSTMKPDEPNPPIPGFYAQSAIFLEPQFPLPTWDLATNHYKIVDSDRSIPETDKVGMRRYDLYNPTCVIGHEDVSFEIRRCRRFNNFGSHLLDVRKFYEIRSSSCLGVVNESNGVCLVEIEDTQFGNLYDSGIRDGDTIKIVTDDNSYSDVVFDVSNNSVKLRKSPPFDVVGKECFFYIKKSPVPHSQSYEESIQGISSVVYESKPNYTTNSGGYVNYNGNYAESKNILMDTGVSSLGGVSFKDLGIEDGDYLVIGPATNIKDGSGEPPIGDFSCQLRPPVHLPGSPSELDDNRGVYRVIDVRNYSLLVTGDLILSGDEHNVLFSDVHHYGIYPVVSGSLLTGGIEGQNTLRPTSYSGENGSPVGSFRGNYLSIAPFGYKILRRNPLISIEAFEFVLQMNERVSSFSDKLRAVSKNEYVDHQRYNYIENISFGVLSNNSISMVTGYDSVSPYANSSDCLSVLDRRFWIMDEKLDDESPIGDPTPYADFKNGEGRPVYPDIVSSILDDGDDIRGLRMKWINRRINMVDGSLIKIKNYERMAQISNRNKK